MTDKCAKRELVKSIKNEYRTNKCPNVPLSKAETERFALPESSPDDDNIVLLVQAVHAAELLPPDLPIHTSVVLI